MPIANTWNAYKCKPRINTKVQNYFSFSQFPIDLTRWKIKLLKKSKIEEMESKQKARKFASAHKCDTRITTEWRTQSAVVCWVWVYGESDAPTCLAFYTSEPIKGEHRTMCNKKKRSETERENINQWKKLHF